VVAALLGALVVAPSACRACEDSEEEEEREALRDNFWRAQVAIVGRGGVKTAAPAIDCASDDARMTGVCGPHLFRFKELAPPLLQATPAPGWRFDHWESTIRARDGAVAPRQGRMPDGPLYLNGWGYEDTGALETVTCVFVPTADASAPVLGRPPAPPPR